MTTKKQGWNTPSEPYIHNHFDSRRWNGVALRDDDIIISTYPKSGTTREQMTILQLLHSGSGDLHITELSPYVELCVEPLSEVVKRLDGQSFRRVIKGHVPINYLPYRPSVRYIDVWRSPFDVAVSLFHHHNNANESYFGAVNENRPFGTKPFQLNQMSEHDWIIRWFEEDGFPYWSYWKHVLASWRWRHRSNVAIFHYSDLRNHESEVKKRADFLGVHLNEELLAKVLKHSSFEHMKSISHQTAPYGGSIWGEGRGKEFFRKGQNGDWKQILSSSEIAKCHKIIRRQLPTDLIDFLVR